MWNLFNQRRELDAEVFAKLRPGDLFGTGQQPARQPEHLVRYVALANVSVLTFFAVVLTRLGAEARAYQDIYAAVWLTGVGIAIAAGAWTLLKLSRRGEASALAHDTGGAVASELSPAVRTLMKKAAVKKLLAIRILIVSALSGCVGLYLGLKGLFLL